MRDKKKIYWFGFVVILIISLALDWFGPYGLTDIFKGEQDGLVVHALDVGQGDAIFIETPDHFQILIDGGPDKSILAQLGKVMSFSDRNIDMIILTHPHSDHVAGLVEVLRRYKIEDIYLTGVLHTSPDYLTFLDLIKEKEISAHEVSAPFALEFDHGIELEFLYPLESFSGFKVENLNNNSIVNRLVYGDAAILLTGDLEIEGEDELLASGQDLSARVLKAGHHGSATSSQEKFLQEVGPDMAIVSSGKGNSFGHPSARTIKRFERMGIQVFRTDERGTVSLATDGETWSLLEPMSWLERLGRTLDLFSKS